MEYSKEFVICPYCKYEHGDAWEWGNESQDVTCDDCGKDFYMQPDFDVVYYTYPKQE